MKFLIITHVPHIHLNNQYFAYAPYVREMNIWTKYVDEVAIVAPIVNREKSSIDTNYTHQNIQFKAIESFDLLNIKSIFFSFFKIPKICFTIFKAMKNADHIHLRCPGNVGLLGCFVQIFFPKKIKTAKYAGNWDANSKQPWSYKWQIWILNNTFLTKNIKVLVYGEWENSSKNIKSFFTASYSENEKISFQPKKWYQTCNFLFVGTLVKGKNPKYAILLIENLIKSGFDVKLDFYGDGILKNELQNYINQNKLDNFIILNGNQSLQILKKAYQNNHFVVLPSESEGWPKAIAEGMFWSCVPISTRVSCVTNMLNDGKRGIFLTMNLEKDISNIISVLENENNFNQLSKAAFEWSNNYTNEAFETEIMKLLQ